jgi:hypothetical protein
MTTKTSKPVELCTYIGPDCDYALLKPTCCKPAVEGRSYCEEHMSVVYQKGTARRKRHKELRVVDDIRMWESLFNEAVEELIEEGEL